MLFNPEAILKACAIYGSVSAPQTNKLSLICVRHPRVVRILGKGRTSWRGWALSETPERAKFRNLFCPRAPNCAEAPAAFASLGNEEWVSGFAVCGNSGAQAAVRSDLYGR